MNIKEFCQQFARQQKSTLKCGNVYSRGRVAYSYGEHYPMAIIRGSRAFINSDRYSLTTSHQCSYMRAALAAAGYELSPRNTDEMRCLARDSTP